MRRAALLLALFLPSAASAPAQSPAPSGQWTLIGPQPLIYTRPDFETGGTQHSGMVNAVAVDPRNSNVVYLGTEGGGVWKTTDGGQSWTPLTDDQPSLQIGALALDPSNPDVVYAGTAGGNLFYSNGGKGILKSTDGGATWTQLAGPLPYGPGLVARIWWLAVSPSDGNVLLALAEGGMYRSADGGDTWKQVIASTTIGYDQIQFDPSNGSIAYACLDTVYKSTDGGNIWKAANGTGSNVLPAGVCFGPGIAPSSPQTLFVGADTQMFKTVDGGQNWTVLNSPGCGGIQVDPVNPDIVFSSCGDVYVSRTTDGGLTWTSLYAPAVPHLGMAFSADGSILYLGGEWGAWAATGLTNASLTLTDLNTTLATQELFGLAIHPTNPAIALAGSQSNGVDMYSGSLQWQWLGCDDGGTGFAFDFMNPSTIYATCAAVASVLKSTDRGASFTQVENGIDPNEFVQGQSPGLAMDLSNSRRLYLALNHVWQSNDGAGTWTAISPALGPGSGLTQALAVAPADPNTVYWGNSNGVYVTTNALSGSGATWTSVSTGLPSLQCTNYGQTCSYLNQIATDPSSAGTAYVGLASYVSGHVFKTTNRGASWTDISGNLPNLKVNDIAVDPGVPGTLYIATEQGVYLTSDGGNTWNPLGTGLPNVAVTALKLQTPTRILYAATQGRSAWDLQLAMAPDFSLSVPSGSTSAAITRGQTASYALSVIPQAGFNQTVSLACTGAPSEATCSVSPASVALDGSSSQMVTVTVTTTAASALLPAGPPAGPGRWPPALWILMLALALALGAGLRPSPAFRRADPWVGRGPGRAPALRRGAVAAILLFVALWASCGGGGGSSGGGGGNPGTPAGTYNLTVSGTYTSGSTVLKHAVTLALTVN